MANFRVTFVVDGKKQKLVLTDQPNEAAVVRWLAINRPRLHVFRVERLHPRPRGYIRPLMVAADETGTGAAPDMRAMLRAYTGRQRRQPR